MSSKLKCVNVIMKTIGRKDAKEAYCKLKFQLTSAVIEAFEWPDNHASEWTPEAPNDEFRCHFIEITPNNKELAAHGIKMDAATIGDFQIQTKAKKEGKNSVKASKRIVDVLRTVKFTEPDSLAHLEAFKVNANKNSEMLIAYDPAPQQGELDGTRVVPHTGEVIDGRQPKLPGTEDGEGKAPTAAEKKQQRADERARFAALRERTKKK